MLRVLTLMTLALTALADEAHPTLKIGSQAPGFALPGTDGKMHTLSDYSSSRVLVIVFLSNHCPVSQMTDSRIIKLVDDYKDKGVALVAINPNSPDGTLFDENRFTDVAETLEGNKIRAEFRHYNFPYLYDGDTQAVADAYGTVATPHVFIFDQDRKLRYEGRFDDNIQASLVKSQDARNAIEALLTGKAVSVTHTAVFGCDTKWKEKRPLVLAQLEKMDAEPVDIAPRFESADDLRQLHNNPTHQLLLVTFWAASSVPSIEQLADTVMYYRLYHQRNLQVVTVAVNPTDDMRAPLDILRKKHASGFTNTVMKNLQISAATSSVTERAFDPDWDGGLPFTVVIAPNGKVVYRQQGRADELQLRRLLLAYMPRMGTGHGDLDPNETRGYWLKK